MAILVKRTAGHAVLIHGQSIVFCCLAGCDEAFDSFEVYKYGASLLYKIPATGNDLNLSTEIREYGRYGRFQVVVFFRVPCFRFCKSILSGMKKLQEIDNIAILQSPAEEKSQICNLTACQEKVIPVYPLLQSNSVESGISAFGPLHKLISKKAESAVTVAAFSVSIGAAHIGFQLCAFCDILYDILRPYLRDRYRK
jgi:hypothetical protein